MKQIYYNKERQKVPIKSWVTDLEGGALEQTKNLANLPFVFKHVALMPDAHQGYGMPIGGVLATKGYVIPNAVGVDIGCSVTAVKTNLIDLTPTTIKQIMKEIRKKIPFGAGKYPEDDIELVEYLKELEEEINNEKK